MSDVPYLVADIGGTHARFALADPYQGVGRPVVLKCADYNGIVEAVEHGRALLNSEPVQGACFGVAAPVTGDAISMTNSSWSFSARGLRSALGLESLYIVNDFAAQSMGLSHVDEASLRQIGNGSRVNNEPIALIGPGTGLGVSCIVSSSSTPIVLAGEGGYVSLPVQDEREIAIWQVLRRRYSRVSAERVLCGSGLVELYLVLCELDGQQPGLADPPQVVKEARSDKTGLAREAVEIFMALLGDTAGNVALTMGARGGVFLSGALLDSISSMLEDSRFRARFDNKGRGETFVREIATTLVLDPFAALGGCLQIIIANQNPVQLTEIGYVAS
ncbi:glucokinase [Hoeflea sp. G2-23]|uniref:Glucokinase n=1 Tax=Hoeflea algicola TaxID=2983763 RepID=A0ABT3Z9R5_9HYPH|nr:glucokinase [Hoeflea algicola]MCY0148526.1 glucokinase [Hoeflea algicola]